MSGDLSREQCLRLLATVTVGRLIVYNHALPVIRPVPFCLVDQSILTPILPGGRIATAAHQGDVVAFEADRTDSSAGVGWSVVVTGVPAALPKEVPTPPSLSRWARTGRTTVLSFPVDDVIGRLGSVVWA